MRIPQEASIALGSSLLLLGLILMLPLGYLGKDVARWWCFALGFPATWIGLIVLFWRTDAVIAVAFYLHRLVRENRYVDRTVPRARYDCRANENGSLRMALGRIRVGRRTAPLSPSSAGGVIEF